MISCMKLFSKRSLLLVVLWVFIANTCRAQQPSALSGSYQLFNPDEIKILPNSSVLDSNSEIKIAIGKKEKIVFAFQNRFVEMWSIENQFLLNRFAFDGNVSLLTDAHDSLLLVLENYDDIDGYYTRMHVVDLYTGSVFFRVTSELEINEFIQQNSLVNLSEKDANSLLLSIQKTWPWQLKNGSYIFEESVSTDNNEFALVQNQFLNFKTLESCTVTNFSNHVLLGGGYTGLSAALYTQNYWSLDDNSSRLKNTYFIIKDIRPNGDTLAMSQRFKLRVDGSYYKSQLTRSSTSRYVCATVNEFFKDTKRDLYVFDIQKNRVHEFLNAGLSSIVFNENDSLFQIMNYEMSSSGEFLFTYELFSADTFKKIAQGQTSFFEFGNAPSKSQQLAAPDRDFGAVYIYSPASKKTFGFFPSGKMFVWNDGELWPYSSVSLGTEKALYCSFVGDKIFVVLKSREAFFIDPLTDNVVCTLLFTPSGETTDVLWFLPDGSFYAPKKTIPKFHMAKGKNAYPLLNYEALLNRPDRILAAIGLADAETIEAFGMAYEKRNFKFNIESLDFNANIPTLNWKSKIPQELNDSLVTFSISMDHASSDPLTVHVLINGVPVYGVNGIQIEANKTEFTCTTTLENGKNELLVYVQNKSGVNSFPISKEIISTYNFQRRLFFVGIGVSEYVDTTKNLTFAHSDVLKLKEEFLSAYDNECRRLVLTNEEATRENILNVKQFLEKTNVNDIVVLAFAGHGTIGANKNFYFCSHDIDFKNPEKTGVSYTEIENLLDLIPARKKLLLLDACHSGEIDSSFTPIVVSDLVVTKDARGIDVIVSEETSSQKEINFLVESLFANLNNGTGAYVISASAGSEYAYETAQTGGVFTYCFIESFKDHFYSYQPDAYISTLQQETYQKVTALTKGAQRPTIRSENTRSSWKFEQ